MRLSQFLKLLSLYSTKTLKNSVVLLLGFVLLTACNTEQHGGWKSKGGDKIPSFERSAEPAMTPSMTARVESQQVIYHDVQSDLLLCEKTSSVKDNSLNLSYSIVGSMVGFDLETALNLEEPKLEIQTLSDKINIKDLKLVDVKDSSSFIDNLLNLIGEVDSKLASDIKEPITNIKAQEGSEISSVNYF